MERIWAPWRMTYLEGEQGIDPCFLCRLGAAGGNDGLVIWRGRLVYALLNAYPYASGHVLVAPYAHVGDMMALPDETLHELVAAVRMIVAALGSEYAPQGFNLGANLGGAAGAGHAEHLHVHVVPRWRGDTNFMTVTGDARVLPEALERTAERLRRAIAQNQETSA